MQNLPTALRQFSFDAEAFAEAKAQAKVLVEVLQSQQASRRLAGQDGSEQIEYLQSVIRLAEMKVIQGQDIPAEKEKLFLYLSEGGSSPTARRLNRLHLYFSLENTTRNGDQHGAAQSSISYASHPKALWDTVGEGRRVCKTAMDPSLPADLAIAVTAANRLLMHAIPRLAQQLSTEYDVEVVAPVFVQTLHGWESARLSLAATELKAEYWDLVEQSFTALAGQEEWLYQLMRHPNLAQWVVTASDHQWEKSDWEAAINKAGLQDDAVLREGWQAVTLVEHTHVFDRYDDQWSLEIPADAPIDPKTNWPTAHGFVSDLLDLGLGWKNTYSLESSIGPASLPCSIVNAAVGMGLARSQCNAMKLAASDGELLVWYAAEFERDAAGKFQAQNYQYEHGNVETIARGLAGRIDRAAAAGGEHAGVYPPGLRDKGYSSMSQANSKPTGLRGFAQTARLTLARSGGQEHHRVLLGHIKSGALPATPAGGPLSLDHPVWTLLAARRHTDFSLRALKNLHKADCINARCTTPEGKSLLAFAIEHGGAQGIEFAMSVGCKEPDALLMAARSGNTVGVEYLLRKGYRASDEHGGETALQVASHSGSAAFALLALAAVKEALMPAPTPESAPANKPRKPR